MIARSLAVVLCLFPQQHAALKGGATPDQSGFARPQVSPGSADLLPTVKRLYGEKHWDEIARLAPVSSPDQPAELDYYRGMALARLERWKEAKEAFESGRQKQPQDKRFPTELAGVAFKQQNFTEATAELRRALRLDSGDRRSQCADDQSLASHRRSYLEDADRHS